MSAKKPNPQTSFDALTGLAHELNAPLQSMVKSSQKLIDDYKTRNFEYVSFKDFKNILLTLEQMNRQLRRCQSTTERMMHLSNGKQNNTTTDEACHVNVVIEEIIEMLRQQLSKAKVKIQVRLADNLPLVRINIVECHQIIHNILVNAIQAMPAGGKIRLRTALDNERGMVTVEVEDEGVGITPEHLSKVFEPFFTTKERGIEQCTGLGLSIVYSIVHAAGGDVHIQSSLRKGTTVRIDLPVAVTLK